jgi:hypothetical protein
VKRKISIPIASLSIVLALSGCSSSKGPAETGTSLAQKDFYISTFDVRPNIGFDADAKEWFWGANFRTVSVPTGTELKCKVIALASDRKTELASYEYPHKVFNNGEVIPYGEFAVLPSAEKSLVKSIETFKIACKKW